MVEHHDGAREAARRRLSVFRICLAILVLAAAVDVGTSVYVILPYRRLGRAVAHYGFGNVPQDEFASFEASFVAVAGWELPIDYAPPIVVLVAFLTAMYQLRRIVEHAGAHTFRYSYGWTAGGLFIPIVNFYRPWLGFAEIRKAALDAPDRSFSGFTLFLAIVALFGSSATRALSRNLDKVASPTDESSFFAFIDTTVSTLEATTAIQLLIHLTFFVYAATMLGRARVLAAHPTAGAIASRFD